MKITVKFGSTLITFEDKDIEKIEELLTDDSPIVSITLKDKRIILLPISKNEFEERIKNGDTTFEISL